MGENIYKSYYLIRDLYFRIHREPLQLTNKIGNSRTLQMREGVFTGGSVVKNLPANAGDTGSSPYPGRPHMLWSK